MSKNCLILLLLSLLSACGGKQTDIVYLQGEIRGLGTDTLYIYGMDNLYDHIDTLSVEKDKFSTTLTTDTLAAVWLLFGDGTQRPLYIGKGDKIKIEGSAAELDYLEITGNKANEELTSFQKELQGLGQPSEKALKEKARTFIEEHPSSLASIYLLEKYFIQTSQPDFKSIKELTGHMTGELKDRPSMNNLLNQIQEAEKADIGKTAQQFQVPDAEGKKIGRTDFKNKYLLIHFWASWDEQSREANAALRPIYKKAEKSEIFALWGISLDVNRTEWEETIKKDTLKWKQSCDFTGWNTLPVKQFSIRTLPTNVLLSPSGRIEGKNLSAEQIDKKREELEQKEKEKKEAEKKMKKKR